MQKSGNVYRDIASSPVVRQVKFGGPGFELNHMADLLTAVETVSGVNFPRMELKNSSHQVRFIDRSSVFGNPFVRCFAPSLVLFWKDAPFQ